MRRTLFAYTVNELGSWLGYVALAVAVYDHTHSAIATAALFVAGRFVPALLVPIVVARVEATPRRGGISGLYLLEGIVAVALAFLLWNFSLPGVLVLAVVDGAAALAASALLRAAVARTEPQREPEPLWSGWAPEEAEGEAQDAHGAAELTRRRANAQLNVAWTTTCAVGPALAGVAVATVGTPTALLIDAGSFLVCAALLADLRAHTAEAAASVRARLAAAWQHLNTAPQLRALLITEAVALVFFASVTPIEVLYAKISLHAGASGYGALLATWGIGMVLGSLVFSRAVRLSLGPLLVAGTLAVGLGYLGMAAAPSLALACGASLLGGVGQGVQWASLISAVQQLSPEAMHGRMMGAVESIGALCIAIGFMFGGGVAALSTPRIAFLVAGAAATVASIVFVRLSSGMRPLRVARAPSSEAEPATGTRSVHARSAARTPPVEAESEPVIT